MSYKVINTGIPEVLLLEPEVYLDSRGSFYESYNKNEFNLSADLNVEFVQDNHSCSINKVLRGIHYQIHHPQGKLVRVVKGVVFDVAVDLRRTSKTFGQWIGVEISDKNQKQLWIPEGFGHGFVVLSQQAEFLYKTTNYWSPKHERTLAWNDGEVNIEWPITNPLVSEKDSKGKALCEAELFD
jgi:dTDP-4-dehydrorhamnose 3,5-epimerase